MQRVRASSEAEMIALFLHQEYASTARYGDQIDACLREIGASPSLLTEPHVDNPAEAAARRQVFACYRGYGTGRPSYLTGFPDTGVSWTWMNLRPAELLDSLLIRYLADHELGAGTRDPREVAKLIRGGMLDPGFSGRVQHLATHLRAGHTVAPIILVSADGGTTRVILEGHTRVLAWALAPETIAPDTEVLLGTSPDIANWDEY